MTFFQFLYIVRQKIFPAILSGSLSVFIFTYPACAQDGSDKEWYKQTIIYNLDVHTFKDSDGNGVGDFNGLSEKLDYLQSLGIDTIWLSPFSLRHTKMMDMILPITKALIRASHERRFSEIYC